MGLLDRKIREALKPLEKTLVEMAEKNAEQNREAMMEQIELMNNSLDALVEEKVRKVLKKDE